MARARTIIIAGAGIGGLTAALALARKGFRVVVLEAARRLEEAGAGIQLSPNATRALISLGLGDYLLPHVVAPEAIRIRAARSGREIARLTLGHEAEVRHGAPYWLIHRGDLQRALLEAAAEQPDIVLKLGVSVADHASHPQGVTVAASASGNVARIMVEEHGIALIGADGLWSSVRKSFGHTETPRFRRRTAWRAIVPADQVEPAWRAPMTNLWLGRECAPGALSGAGRARDQSRRHHARQDRAARLERAGFARRTQCALRPLGAGRQGAACVGAKLATLVAL